jgi:hypothetical protein
MQVTLTVRYLLATYFNLGHLQDSYALLFCKLLLPPHGLLRSFDRSKYRGLKIYLKQIKMLKLKLCSFKPIHFGQF